MSTHQQLLGHIVDNYIANQMEHHASEPVEVEHQSLLDKHEVDDDMKYVRD